MRVRRSAKRRLLVTTLTVAATIGAFLTVPESAAAAGGNVSLSLAKTVSSASFVPTLSATLTTDHATAIPGDPVKYTAHLTNTGAILTVTGSVTAANGNDADGTVVDWYDEIEFKDTTGAWIPLGGYQATQAGYAPVSPSPVTTGLTVQYTPNPASGVTYPSTGDHVLGTAIGAGTTASWAYSVGLTVPATVVPRLAAAGHTGGIRNVVHIEATPRPTGNQPFIVRTEFTNPFSGGSTALTDAKVTFTLPDGTTRTVDSSSVAALASIATGATVDAPTTWTVPVPAPPAADESEAAYLSRLGALQGSTLVALATASATGGGTTVSAAAGSVTTTEELPIVTVGKSGPATLDAGATGTYTLPLSNTGGASAGGITLTDRVPDGAHGTLDGVPATLAAGATKSATATFPVPTTQPDGPLTDTAQVSWVDGHNNPYGPVSASFTTTITSSLAGATLTLTPTVAGPDVVGTDQALTVTLVDRNGVPVNNTTATVTVTGANTASGTVTTGTDGTAVFHYSGTGPGLDTAQATVVAGAAHLQSNTSQIGWVSPIAPVSSTPVTGNFYTETASATTFVAKPTDTPTFGQTFPALTFNPSATALAHNVTGVGPTTHPFTDVTTDMVGNGIGTIVAQGNGKQAGIAPMTSFDAVFTANLVVAKPGDITFQFDYDAGFMFGVGGGASRVNGVYEGAPATNTSPFQGFPLVGADNTPGNAVRTSLVTVHFPAAGSYPYEVDYTESGGPTLSLVMSIVSFTQDTSGINVYAGYADGLRPGGSIFPFPWNGSPNTVFVGCHGNCLFDAGAVRLDNTTGHTVTINSLTVDIGNNCRFAIWPADTSLPDGQTAIFTQTISGASSGCPRDGSFDTSDAPLITCTPTGLIPHITFVVDGVTHSFDDTQQIINTKGTDKAECPGGNESQAWQRLGGNGIAVNTPLPPAGAVTLSPLGGTATVTSVQAPAGTAQSFRVAVMDASGLPVASTPVDVTIAGAHPGHILATTGADGTTVVSYNAGSAGDDTLQARAFITGLSTQSGILTVHWALPPGTVPDPGNPGQTLPAPPPVIGAPAPADGTRVTAPIPVKATITPPDGESITSWKVTYQGASPGSPLVTLATGTGTPPATLATFDPTLLIDDTYTISVSATSSGGGIQTATTTVAVAGNLKLGRYATTYQDVDVPVDGQRMQVLRGYDSLDKRVGDFGVGWRVSLGNFRISANRALGAGGWTEYPTACGLFGCSWAFKSSVPHVVTVTFPDQHQEVFDFTPSGGFSVFYFLGTAAFTARPGTGTTSTLEPLDNGISYDFAGNIDSGLFGEIYAPTRFRLTTRDGHVYVLDTSTGLVSATDRNGNTVSVDTSGVHASNGESITYTRDGQGRITRITEPAGQAITYTYSPAGDLASATYPDGAVLSYSYDADHNLTGVTGRGGQQLSTVEYDAAGRVTAVTDGSGRRTAINDDVAGQQQVVTSPSGRLTTVYTLDDLGDILREDDIGDGTTRTTSNTYDSIGHLLSTTDALGHRTSATYDAAGDLTSVTDANGNTTRYTYNANGRPLSQVAPDGVAKAVLTYDQAGNVASRQLGDGSTTTYTYDRAGRLLSVTDPGGRTISYGYDASGHVSSVTDPLGNRTAVAVDANGLVTSMTDPLGAQVSMTYDTVGNLASITDPAGNTQSYTHDDFDNITSTTDGLGHKTVNTYDGASRLTSSTTSDGVATTYTYDGDGNLITKAVGGGDTDTYTYNAFNELTTARNSTAQLSYTYDAAGQETSSTSSGSSLPTVSHTYTYDADGARLSATGPEGSLTYTYDADGRLQTLVDYAGHTFRFGYDQDSRLASLQRPNGISDTLSYDVNGDLQARDAMGPTQVPVGRADYTYDGYGRRLSTTDLTGTSTYTYDANGQLLTANHPAASGLPAESYSYDLSGNRTTGSTQYNAGQQLVQDAQFTYQYNAAGDLIARTDRTSNAVTTYTWDAEHHLRSSTLPDGTTVGYRYDPLGHPVEQTTGAQTVRYGYDDAVISAAYDGTNTLTSTYLHAPTRDSLLEVRQAGQTYYPTVDGLGSVTGLTDGSGALVQRYAYDSFGNSTASGPVSNPFQFTGKRLDAATGQYDYGLRRYAPGIGRFTAPDPLPAANPYPYTSNDPVNLTDPSGAQDEIEEVTLDAEAEALLARGEADVTVYYARNAVGDCYFGITNNFARRALQHEASGKGFVVIEDLELQLTRNEARVVEQQLITRGGGAISDGGTLINKINSIAQGGPLWNLVVNVAVSFVDVSAVLASAGCP